VGASMELPENVGFESWASRESAEAGDFTLEYPLVWSTEAPIHGSWDGDLVDPGASYGLAGAFRTGIICVSFGRKVWELLRPPFVPWFAGRLPWLGSSSLRRFLKHGCMAVHIMKGSAATATAMRTASPTPNPVPPSGDCEVRPEPTEDAKHVSFRRGNKQINERYLQSLGSTDNNGE
jgi:hypothetical protein